MKNLPDENRRVSVFWWEEAGKAKIVFDDGDRFLTALYEIRKIVG